MTSAKPVAGKPVDPLLTPFRLKHLTMRNRIIVPSRMIT